MIISQALHGNLARMIMTKFEWTMTSGAKLACDVVVNVTTPGGGDTTNIDALEFEVTCYGKPTYTPVVAA